MLIRQVMLITMTILTMILAIANAPYAETIDYSYDTMGRLIQATYGDGTVVEYTYDKAGNRTSLTTAAAMTLPGVPTAVNATAGNAQATIHFTPPTNNGGTAITGYTVTSAPGGKKATGKASPLIVTGLTNGTAYTFTVTATNAVGSSVKSTASNSVTPAPTVPGKPIIGTATKGNARAKVTFKPPASNGGSAIISYTVTSIPGGKKAKGTASPLTVLGLTNGKAYKFIVQATNALGTGLPSAASNSVTPSR